MVYSFLKGKIVAPHISESPGQSCKKGEEGGNVRGEHLDFKKKRTTPGPSKWEKRPSDWGEEALPIPIFLKKKKKAQRRLQERGK